MIKSVAMNLFTYNSIFITIQLDLYWIKAT